MTEIAEEPLARRARILGLCLVEARPTVQVVFVLRFAVGAAFAIHYSAGPFRLLAGVGAWWLAVVCAYLLNGATDVTEDRVNGSTRPIAEGELAVRTAVIGAACFGVSALALATAVPHLVAWVAVYVLLGWLYSAPPVAAKRWSASCTAVVFGLGWCSYAAGLVCAQGSLSRSAEVFAAAMAGWMALVGAVVKDFGDAVGDAVVGRRTVAVVHGERTGRLVAAAGTIVVGAGAPVAAAIWAPIALAGAVPLSAGALWMLTHLLRGLGQVGGDRRARRKAYRAFMVTQYAANAAMLAALLIAKLHW